MHVADSTDKPLFDAYTEVDFSDALGGTRMEVVQSYTLVDPSKVLPAPRAMYSVHRIGR